MAINTADIVLEVDRPAVVAVLLIVGMATEATRADLFRRNSFEREDFGFVAATLHVSTAWPVASFAAVF